MNILSFDIEEWYLDTFHFPLGKKLFNAYDYYLKSTLDLLDEYDTKATFFCIGGMATHFPEIVKTIADRGHEIGCHSNTHSWLSTFDRDGLIKDTKDAIMSLEDVIGKKVISYRAPAFSIGESNKWALEVLAECGIERDASLYPAIRDFGGFESFPSDQPSIIRIGNSTINEFPISLTTLLGKQLAYSGGGYFRFFPIGFIKRTMKNSNYAMTYFHLWDLMYHPMHLTDKDIFEKYYKAKPTMKNRVVRMIKGSLGTKGAFDKMCNLVRTFDFVNLEEADASINWNNTKIIDL